MNEGSEVVIASVGTGGCHRLSNDVDTRIWTGSCHRHSGPGTAFVMALEPTVVTVAHGVYPLSGRSYAVLPREANIDGGSGVTVTHRAFLGLFQIGGPVESVGRLRYIDGCSDTVLVAPVVRGAPCLNLLHLPGATRQTDHHHPSVRVGLVVAGQGTCVLNHIRRVSLQSGSVFVLPEHTIHRFETEPGQELLVMAWHPDSDTGPTDDDHPMINRTLRPASVARHRDP